MDPNNHDIGYLLGRLMAVIERMHQISQTPSNDNGATIVDKYFSGASTSPEVVFPRLMKNMRQVSLKARDAPQTAKTARGLENLVDEIMSNIEAIPAHLSQEQQGLFVVGYHHQRKLLWHGHG
jgi:CRISPR-associated protein Csd1